MLTPPQTEVLESGLLTSGFSCVLQMPTGSGKTWLAETAIEHVLRNGGRAIYLTPLRALGAELITRWQNRFTAPVGIFTGDYGTPGHSYPVAYLDAYLYIMTPERLDSCTRAWRTHWKWLPEVDLIVADELHLLGDSQRGGRLEGTLSRFRRLNPFVRILGLSATLGNRAELADWLDGVEYRSTWRPVPLEWRIMHYQKAYEKPDLLVSAVHSTLVRGGKSLVFVHSRSRAEELARFLQNKGLRALHHHAGLTQDNRRDVEQSYRAGKIDVLVSTATLEMGLNLPVRQVVLYDLQTFDGIDFIPLATNTVWQRAGRAGRPGLDESGEVVLLSPVWDKTVIKYRDGHFEPIKSSFSDPRVIAEQIITEVVSGLCRTPRQLERSLSQSLAAKQGRLLKVGEILNEMIASGMLCESTDEEGHGNLILRATRLGRIAVRHFLTPASVIRFHEALQQPIEWTFMDLLLLISSCHDCQPILPVDYEVLNTLATDLSQEPSTLLQLSQKQLSEILGISGKRLLAALKMALVLRKWSRTAKAETVAEGMDCYPYEVTQLVETASRLLLALNQILEKPKDGEIDWAELQDLPMMAEKISVLAKMISGGLDEYAITLTAIEGIGPKLANRLQAVGYNDIEALALAEPDELVSIGGISPKRAQHWVEQAQIQIRSTSAWHFRETYPHTSLCSTTWPIEIDPYRLRRALDLSVVGSDAEGYQITGGLEPHRVWQATQEWCCDCQDHAKHRCICKHILAVRISHNEQSLMRLIRQLQQGESGVTLNLFDLWFATTPNTYYRRLS